MAPKTKKDRRAEAAEKRRKQIEALKIRNKNRSEDRKLRSLRTVNKRGKVVGQKNKMSTFKAQSSYDIAKQQSGSKTGMSNLGAGYKKAEEKLSKDATRKSAKISKARYSLLALTLLMPSQLNLELLGGQNVKNIEVVENIFNKQTKSIDAIKEQMDAADKAANFFQRVQSVLETQKAIDLYEE